MRSTLNDLTNDELEQIYQPLRLTDKAALAFTSTRLSVFTKHHLRTQFKARFVKLFKQHQFGELKFDAAFDQVPLTYLHYLETKLSFATLPNVANFDWYNSNKNIFELESPALWKLITAHFLTTMGCYYINSAHLRLLAPLTMMDTAQYQLDIERADQVTFIKTLIQILLKEKLFLKTMHLKETLEEYRLTITEQINKNTHLQSILWIYQFVENRLQRLCMDPNAPPLDIPLEVQKQEFNALTNQHVTEQIKKFSNVPNFQQRTILFDRFDRWTLVRVLNALSHFSDLQAEVVFWFGLSDAFMYQLIIFISEYHDELTRAAELIRERTSTLTNQAPLNDVPLLSLRDPVYFNISQTCHQRGLNPLDILADISTVAKEYHYPNSAHDFFLLMYICSYNIPLANINNIVTWYYDTLNWLNYKKDGENIKVWEAHLTLHNARDCRSFSADFFNAWLNVSLKCASNLHSSPIIVDELFSTLKSRYSSSLSRYFALVGNVFGNSNIHLFTESTNAIIKDLVSTIMDPDFFTYPLSATHPIFRLSSTEYKAILKYTTKPISSVNKLSANAAERYLPFKEKLKEVSPLERVPAEYVSMFVDFIFSKVISTAGVSLGPIRSNLLNTVPAYLELLLMRLPFSNKPAPNRDLSWLPIIHCIKASPLLSSCYLNAKDKRSSSLPSTSCFNLANTFILKYLSDNTYDALYLKFSSSKLPNNFIESIQNPTCLDLVTRLIMDIDSTQNKDINLLQIKCDLLSFITDYSDFNHLIDEISVRYSSYAMLIADAEAFIVDLSLVDLVDMETKRRDLKQAASFEDDDNTRNVRPKR